MLLMLAVVACRPSRPVMLDDKSKEEVRREATLMLQQYADQICKKGLGAEFAFLDSSQDFYWLPPGAHLAMGYDTVAASIRRNAKAIDSVCISWTSLEVAAIAIDTAGYAGNLHSWSVTRMGDTTVADLRETGVLIRRKSGWKLLGGQTDLQQR